MAQPERTSPDTHQFSADLIQSSAGAIASLTVEQLFADRPACRERYAPLPTAKWRDSILARLGYLSTALATGHEQLFVDQVAWAKAAHFARGGPDAVEDLRASLRALHKVLLSELPPPHARSGAKPVERALEFLESAPEYLPTSLSGATPQSRLAAKYLLAVLGGDRRSAADMILSAVAGADGSLRRDRVATVNNGGSSEVNPDGTSTSQGHCCFSVQEIYADILLPVQRELGRMWHMNEINVGEEHFATATTQLVVSLLYPYLPRSPSNGRTVVAGSVEGNAHEIGIRMLTDLLESRGWRAIYLGANVPAEDFAQAVADFGADLVTISASIATQLPHVERTISAAKVCTLGDHRRDHRAGQAPIPRVPKFIVGGTAFVGCPDLWHSVGADGYADSLNAGLELADRIVGAH